MTDKMLDKAAKAAEEAAEYDRDDLGYEFITNWPEIARAALQTIRDDLPDSIIREGERAAWDSNNSMPAVRAMPKGWAAIIDAILSETN